MLFIHKETGEILELTFVNYQTDFYLLYSRTGSIMYSLYHLEKNLEFLGWL